MKTISGRWIQECFTPSSVNAPNGVVSVLKKSEDGEDLIVRCYETAGRATPATLNPGLVKRQWTGTFHPLGIKTLCVAPSGGEVREVNVLEEWAKFET